MSDTTYPGTRGREDLLQLLRSNFPAEDPARLLRFLRWEFDGHDGVDLREFLRCARAHVQEFLDDPEHAARLDELLSEEYPV